MCDKLAKGSKADGVTYHFRGSSQCRLNYMSKYFGQFSSTLETGKSNQIRAWNHREVTKYEDWKVELGMGIL